MVAHGEHGLRAHAKLTRQFRQSSAFVVSLMAKAGINVVTDNGETRHAAAVISKIPVNDIRLPVVAGDQAKGGVCIFVDACMEAGIDPSHNPWQVLLDAVENL